MGKHPKFGIQTRQKDDELFRTTDPVQDPEPFASPIRRVSGYGGIRFLIFSDVAFRLRIEQAPPVEGGKGKNKVPANDTFVETGRLTSTLNDAGTHQIICAAVMVCSEFMRIFVDNISGAPMAELELSGMGHPIGEGAATTGGGGIAAEVTLRDCATTTEASIKADGAAVSAAPCDGGLMISGRDGSFQRHIRVNSNGELIVDTTDAPGATITTIADTPVGIGLTVPLPAPPAGTTRMTVQSTGGDASTRLRIREVGGPAGSGALLLQFGSRGYGSPGGAVAPLEVENVAGPATTVGIQFEGP